MKHKLLFLIIAALSTVGFGQSANNEKVAGEIKKMDTQWIIEAYSSKDLADFDRIVADDFIFTGANGKVQDRSQKRSTVKGDYSEDPASGGTFKIEEASHKVRLFGNTAISMGFIIENYTWKTQKINGHVHFTNIYLKRKGKWQVVQSHFTNVKL